MTDKSFSTFGILKRLYAVSSRRQRKKLIIFVVLSVLSSFAEVFSFAILIPFLEIASGSTPENKTVGFLGTLFDPSSAPELALELYLIFFLFLSLTAFLVKFVALVLGARFAASMGSSLSQSVYEIILSDPLINNKPSGSSEILVLSIVEYIKSIIVSVVFFMKSTASFIVACFILVALVLLTGPSSLIPLCIVAFFYFLFFKHARNLLVLNSNKINSLSQHQLQHVNQSLQHLDEISLYGCRDNFKNLFLSYDVELRSRQASNVVISDSPRYLIEFIGFSTLVLLTWILQKLFAVSNPLVEIATIAFAIQKLIPSLQQIYSSSALILSYKHQTSEVLDILEKKRQVVTPIISKASSSFSTAITLTSLTNNNYLDKQCALHIKDLNHKIGNKKSITCDEILINKGDRISISGPSGCGKSTFLSILTLLREPDHAKYFVNGTKIRYEMPLSNIHIRGSNFSYVPQNISIINGSLAENIAFTTVDEIDITKLNECLRLAELHDVVASMPNGHNTIIKNSFSRSPSLSGGQLKRLGIARALYFSRPILCMDEATTGLEANLELTIMSNLFALTELTILYVSHSFQALSKAQRSFCFSGSNIQERILK